MNCAAYEVEKRSILKGLPFTMHLLFEEDDYEYVFEEIGNYLLEKGEMHPTNAAKLLEFLASFAHQGKLIFASDL